MLRRPEDMAALTPYAPEGFYDNATLLSLNPVRNVASTMGYKDRGLANHQEALGFATDQFPSQATILVIGSGATRLFERELAAERPDTTIVSVDPMLRYGVTERQAESRRMAADWHDNAYISRDNPDYYRPGAVSGGFAMRGEKDSDYLPFGEASFDAILALHSLPQHLPGASIPPFVGELARVMKPGAWASLYPMYNDYIQYVPSDEDAALSGITPIQLDHPQVTYPDGPLNPYSMMRLRFSRLVTPSRKWRMPKLRFGSSRST